jgi:hypothetical protein
MVKLPVYEMLIDDELSSDLEIDFIALVDFPAIKRPFLKFNDEFIAPSKGQNKESFLPKCISYVINEGKNNDQAVAICNSIWEQHFADESYSDYPDAESKIKQIERKSFAIQNEEQRIISGPLMIPNQKIYRFDKETETEYEVYFSPETIKKIAIKYAKRGFQKNVNIMHNPDMVASGVTLFEIFQSDKSRGIKAMEGFEDLPDGTLFGSMYVENDVAWDMVKNDIVKGFSVEGNFGMKLKSKYEMQFEKIVEILNSVK